MIQSIVEGDGEVTAFPVLLRRLVSELGCYEEIGTPIRSKRTLITKENEFKNVLLVAANKTSIRAVVVLFDADDDCARDVIPRLRQWSQEVVPFLPCSVIMARREYEAWFLAAIESLRGERRIRETADYLGNPEEKRGAKGIVSRFMPQNKPYSETADQAALSAIFDLGQAYRRTSSFRKLIKELCHLLVEMEQEPVIPEQWLTQ